MKSITIFFVFYCQLYLAAFNFLGIIPFRFLGSIIALIFLFNSKIIFPKKFVFGAAIFTLFSFITIFIHPKYADNLIPLLSNNLINLSYIVLVISLWFSDFKKNFLIILISLLMLNALSLIFQFFYLEQFTKLLDFFTPGRFIDIDFERNLSKHKSISGFFGEVYSGYTNIVLLGLLLYFLETYKENRILIYSLLIITMYAVYLLGQRSSFFCIILLLFFYLKSFNFLKYKIWLSLFLLMSFISVFNLNFRTIGDFNFDLLFRSQIYINSLAFISENFLIPGGLINFKDFNDNKSPHNIFLTAFVEGGFFLFLYLLYFLKSIFTHSSLKSFPFLIFLMLFLSSIAHNHGILSFELFTWSFMIIGFLDSKSIFNYEKKYG